MLGKLLATSLLAVTALGGIASCGGSDSAPVDCATVTPKKYSEISSAIAKCTNCHSSDRSGDKRHGATVMYDYNTADLAAMQAQLAGADVAGTGAHVMPPIGQNCPVGPPAGPACAIDGGGAVPSLTAQEKLDIQAWACNPMP